MKIISINPAVGIELPRQMEKTVYHTQSKDFHWKRYKKLLKTMGFRISAGMT